MEVEVGMAEELEVEVQVKVEVDVVGAGGGGRAAPRRLRAAQLLNGNASGSASLSAPRLWRQEHHRQCGRSLHHQKARRPRYTCKRHHVRREWPCGRSGERASSICSPSAVSGHVVAPSGERPPISLHPP